MKRYAEIDLSMKTTHGCIVDANELRVGALCVESMPKAIAVALERHGPIDRAVIETGRNQPTCRTRPARTGCRRRLHRRTSGTPEPEGDEGQKEVRVKSSAAHGVRSVTPFADIWSARASDSTT